MASISAGVGLTTTALTAAAGDLCLESWRAFSAYAFVSGPGYIAAGQRDAVSLIKLPSRTFVARHRLPKMDFKGRHLKNVQHS